MMSKKSEFELLKITEFIKNNESEITIEEFINMATGYFYTECSNYKEILKLLKRKDCTDKQISNFIMLYGCIKIINLFIPSEGCPIGISVTKKDSCVWYTNNGKKKNKKERYDIFIKNLNIKPVDFMLIDINGNLANDYLYISPIEIIISRAFHEARHRVQFNNLAKPFSRKTKITGDKQLDEYACYCRYFLKWEKYYLQKKKRSWKYVKARTSNLEFDAYLIQSLFEAELISSKKINSKKLRDLLFLTN